MLTLNIKGFSQSILTGIVTDANTGEPLIGATILFGKGKGTATDFEGNYSILIQPGERNLTASYVGYQELSKRVVITEESQ